MTVWYLHGLESSQGGPKVEFLESVAKEVFAPSMEYSNPLLFQDLLELAIYSSKPDLIIGSSMGGYFADALGSHLGVEVLLFNPALHSRRFEPGGVTYGENNYKRHIVVGELDNIIDPKLTKVLAEISETFIVKEGMGHRTSLITFIDIYSKLFVNDKALASS